MTKPVYKIEVYDSTPTLIHTIEKDALSIYSKEVVTKGVGHFSFTVPAKKNGDSYYYDDIDLHDMVKIWYGYDSVSGNPDFIGKVAKIFGGLSTQSGYIRQFSGLSQGEILLRRFKKNKLWQTIDASVIATELATDLSLGTGDIVADTIDIDLESETKTYFDVLMQISDYWYDVSNKVQKDFHVDVDNDLVWKARPIRTADVESFTVGEDILRYNVIRDVASVKNDIVVYGSTYTTPSDKDALTEGTAGWTSDGALTADASNQKRGTYSVKTTGSSVEPYMQKTFSSIKCGWKNHRYLNFWFYLTDTSGLAYGGTYTVYLLAPDASNRFRHGVNTPGLASWLHYSQELGPHNNVWVADPGSPDWDDIQGFRFWFTDSCVGACATDTVNIDELYFADQHYYGSASDATSQTNYGQRDYEVTDKGLLSDADCTKRAETMLLQKKDPAIQIDILVPGNTNVLVGDRLSMTIPAENISAANYDVISVEHFLSNAGFTTRALMMNSINIREPIEATILDVLINARKQIRELSRDEKIVL